MKPDLIPSIDDTDHVVDVQIVKCSDLNESHRKKVDKYQKPDLEYMIKGRYSVNSVKYHSCKLSFKSISQVDLKRLGVSEYCIFKIVTSTLRGTWLSWKHFNAIISCRRELV